MGESPFTTQDDFASSSPLGAGTTRPNSPVVNGLRDVTRYICVWKLPCSERGVCLNNSGTRVFCLAYDRFCCIENRCTLFARCIDCTEKERFSCTRCPLNH